MSKLQEVLQRAVDDGFEIEISSYSERGMYGATCLAIVTDLNPIEVGVMIGQSGIDIYEVRNTRTDNMGLSTVYYWPNVKYERYRR